MNNILCIGDSLTFGYGVGKDKSWVSLLETKENKFINKGVNGDTSTGILSRIYENLKLYNPNICLILCGSNDILMNKPLDLILDNIKLMVDDCLLLKITPVILSPPKIYSSLASVKWDKYIDYERCNLLLSTYSKNLELFCKKNNLLYIDINSKLKPSPSNYTDGLHLSLEGNILVCNIVKEGLNHLL